MIDAAVIAELAEVPVQPAEGYLLPARFRVVHILRGAKHLPAGAVEK